MLRRWTKSQIGHRSLNHPIHDLCSIVLWAEAKENPRRRGSIERRLHLLKTRRGARDQELQKMRKGKAEGVIRERSGRRRNLTSTLNATQRRSQRIFTKASITRAITFQDKIQELSKEDYFSKNNEFATWLKDEKNVYFSDLSSESARELFSNFVELWNDRKLKSRYYEGISSGPRTSHNWKIKE